MPSIGYAHLIETLRLDVPPLKRPARIRPLTRVEIEADHVGIPPGTAPKTDAPVDHLLFALKHEGPNLGVLMQALRKTSGADLVRAVRDTPTGAYARSLGLLWEHANAEALVDLPAIGGYTAKLFRPERYVTGASRRNAKWRVDFNGLGSLDYCATVERTASIDAGTRSDLLRRVDDYAAGLTDAMRDRVLAWAYLSETKESFAIERERPTESKQERFVDLLRRAHDARPLSEGYLTELQQATITNPLDVAGGFRERQNHLEGPHRGAQAVTYVPPPPALGHELMNELMGFSNRLPSTLDPIIAAAIVSFGFVFIHPFMDGNGRLSRFLFHHTLCRAKALPDGLILPVSIAMKKHEDRYLRALRTFSVPAREAWDVLWLDGDRFDLTYRWADRGDLYRYWDATACVEFSYEMAEQALAVELRQEVDYLQHYDAIVRLVNDEFDVRQSDLASLVRSALQSGGRVSNNQRKKFADRVDGPVFDFLESSATRVLAGSDDDVSSDDRGRDLDVS